MAHTQRRHAVAEDCAVEGVDLDPDADVLEHGHGQLATEVLTELLDTGEHGELARRGLELERRVPQRKPDRGDRRFDPRGEGRREQPNTSRVGTVESDADGHGLAVAEIVVAEQFELVRGPVTKIEGAGAAELEGVPRATDVGEVELGAATDHVGARLLLTSVEGRGVRLESLEEATIADQRDLDGLGDARDPSVEMKRMSLMTAEGGAKQPIAFLLPKRLTPFLTPMPASF